MHQARLTTDPELIEAIIELRYEILRKPWGKPKETATDELESRSVNAYIEDQGKIVACGRLQDNGGGIGQVRYMAVAEGQQGKGLGKLILNRLEEEALAMGIRSIELQARENAVEFYKAQGYAVRESSFKLWDIIQHYLMTKQLQGRSV
jgi:N-acetylglutamate synthase-like GNAT family acetyltransferase